jgi:hypothetical protein
VALSRDELIARNRARSQQLRSGGGLPRAQARVPRSRRAVSLVETVPVYTILFICLVLAVVGLIGGDDYFHLGDVPARAWAVVLGLAAFFAVFFIGGHYWPNLRLILYGAWLLFGVAIGVATGDEEVIGGLWAFALVGIFIVLPMYVVKRRKRRQPRRLPG